MSIDPKMVSLNSSELGTWLFSQSPSCNRKKNVLIVIVNGGKKTHKNTLAE